MKEILAFHEAGHFVMNVLLRQMPTEMLHVEFPNPSSIWINEADKLGEVVGAGFPIHNWKDEHKAMILYEGNHYFPNVYKENKRLAIAVILENFAGFIADTNFVSTGKECYQFGEEIGEKFDSSNVEWLLPYALPKYYKDSSIPGYDSDINNTREKICRALKGFFKLKEIKDAIYYVANNILEKPKDEGGRQELSQEEVSKLEEAISLKLKGRASDLEKLIEALAN